MAQDAPQAPFHYAAPGLTIALFGALFSAASGTYVGWHSRNEITLGVMQAFLVYSAPYVLLGGTGLIAYQINRVKTLAVLYALSTTTLTASAITIVTLAAEDGSDLIERLHEANGRAFITGLVIAVLASALLLYAAKRIRPREKTPRPEDDLPF